MGSRVEATLQRNQSSGESIGQEGGLGWWEHKSRSARLTSRGIPRAPVCDLSRTKQTIQQPLNTSLRTDSSSRNESPGCVLSVGRTRLLSVESSPNGQEPLGASLRPLHQRGSQDQRASELHREDEQRGYFWKGRETSFDSGQNVSLSSKKKKKFSSDRRKIPISNNNETDSTNILEDFRGSRSKMSTTAGNKVDVIPPPDNIGALQMI